MAQLQSQRQAQSQKQIQKMSQVQIQAMNYLAMTSRDLRQEIFKAVEENPALEIVADPKKNFAGRIFHKNFFCRHSCLRL